MLPDRHADEIARCLAEPYELNSVGDRFIEVAQLDQRPGQLNADTQR